MTKIVGKYQVYYEDQYVGQVNVTQKYLDCYSLKESEKLNTRAIKDLVSDEIKTPYPSKSTISRTVKSVDFDRHIVKYKFHRNKSTDIGALVAFVKDLLLLVLFIFWGLTMLNKI